MAEIEASHAESAGWRWEPTVLQPVLPYQNEKARLIRPGFFVCDIAIQSSDSVALQVVGTIGGDTIALQVIGAIGGDTIALQVIGTIGGDAIALQVVGTISCDAVTLQVVGAIGGDAVALQVVRAISRHSALFDQAIRTALSHTAFNQTIRAAFSDHRLSRSRGESVHCENRESDAEEGLAFHDRVLRGVMGWYGADVTPRIF
ncbi:hypothetical protein LAB08_R38450 [Pseudomonas izuensis]|uniref:Uncharacterized protein n=1 Tax=Pseudomonas izuensis TaxID=2684212 RepID=A0ABM7RVI8_9PSED|nr:hypothetical protein LAB08_R38450 [Pseudomonas izuensis]